jgi:hypothetical protein
MQKRAAALLLTAWLAACLQDFDGFHEEPGATASASAATTTSAGSGAGGAGGSGEGGSGALDCDAIFATVAGYELCAESAEECRFSADLDMTTNCGEVCSGAGTSCLGARHNGDPCDDAGPTTCAEEAGNNICICSKGCGAGAPCPASMTCTNESCV